ncbi:5'/3'-nucleotidase SurE [Ilyomonas limi]|uniref:5'-nucleotidase SurE n=1 Tax=Ilyomonas limi TaxID=2575867 RepID=A0A4V5UTT4_9BACT|nr:5'/3'-nucleotidase SurE [Ilyomonas limi]TKK66373.1 5'/3'-nucleotidase SurE [Ilyomonas limi]
MKILISNDDGIYSPGIAALAKSALKFGQVTVVAPDVEQSSMGHAVTHSKPLSIKAAPIKFEGIEAFRVNGTPGDCVALGTHIHANTDVVLSGINMGPNLGNGMWHSGTLAAAKQGVLLGYKGIAFSTLVGKSEPDFDKLVPFVEQCLELLLKTQGKGLYNVNLPENPRDIKWTRQSVRFYDGIVMPGTDPFGRKHYWFNVRPLEAAEEGSDRWAFENDFVSITPLCLDLTDHEQLRKVQEQQPL